MDRSYWHYHICLARMMCIELWLAKIQTWTSIWFSQTLNRFVKLKKIQPLIWWRSRVFFFSRSNICVQHTGYPVRAAKRAQLNMFIKKVNQIDVTQKLPTALLPILWIDEGIELNDELQRMIKNRLLIILLLLKIVHYGLVAGGVLVFLVFSTWYLIRRHHRSSTKITPLTWMLLTVDYVILK